MSLLVPGNNFNWGRRFDRFSKLNWQPPPPLWPIWPPRWLSATVRSLISRVLYEICIYTHTHTHACWVCVCMFIRLSMSMNESSSKLRIKVYYFLFGSLLFSADLYNNFFTHLSPPSEHVPPPPHFFQKPSSDCLRIVASLQFEFLRDLHKSFRPHNSTEIAVYSVSISLPPSLSFSISLCLVVCIFQVIIYREIYIIYERNEREIEKKLNSNRQNIATDWGTIFQEF